MNKYKRIQNILEIIFGMAIICLIVVIIFNPFLKKDESSDIKTDIKAKKLIINTDANRTDGVIIIKDSDGELHDQYGGSIDILNDGSNGEQIKINVIIPSEKNGGI